MRRSTMTETGQQLDPHSGEAAGYSSPAEPETFETPHFTGEMFQTVFGHLQGDYVWECDHMPSEEAIREGMCVRVVRDCKQFRKHDCCTELTVWHGGWTREGVGIFTTDLQSTSRRRRTRHLGQARVIVRTPLNHGGSAASFQSA